MVFHIWRALVHTNFLKSTIAGKKLNLDLFFIQIIQISSVEGILQLFFMYVYLGKKVLPPKKLREECRGAGQGIKGPEIQPEETVNPKKFELKSSTAV